MHKVVSQIALGLLLSANLATIFAHGLFGLGSRFTAGYLLALTVIPIFLGSPAWNKLILADYLAVALVIWCALSTALHPATELKDIALLGLSIAAYASARGFAGAMQSRIFLTTLAIIITIGAVSTVVALVPLVLGGPDEHGKPVIFGYDHGPTVLASLFGLLVFSLSCSRVSLRSFVPAVAVGMAIFSAAMVRFSLAALVAILVFGAIIAPLLRRRLAVVALVATVAIAIGMLCRLTLAMEYFRYIEDTFEVAQSSAPAPSGDDTAPAVAVAPVAGAAHRHTIASWISAPGCPDVNLNNSIEMREQLYKDAIAKLPSAGLFGIGLGTFAKTSCVNAEPHNSYLQLAIELGIPGGLILAALPLAAGLPLLSRAPKEPASLIALLSLAFVVLITFAHGRITEDGLLFFYARLHVLDRRKTEERTCGRPKGAFSASFWLGPQSLFQRPARESHQHPALKQRNISAIPSRTISKSSII